MNNTQFAFDDRSSFNRYNLRVAYASFEKSETFDWELFRGFDSMRVLTYSASIKTVLRMLQNYSFAEFECVFGYEDVLNNFNDILSFQKYVIKELKKELKDAIIGFKDKRHAQIMDKVRDGTAHFFVVKDEISHSKLYLLKSKEGMHRVITGSANLSESAFSGRQAEEIIVFDNDPKAWDYFTKEYEDVRKAATDEIELPDDIETIKVRPEEIPALKSKEQNSIYVVETGGNSAEPSPGDVIRAVEKIASPMSPMINPLAKANNGSIKVDNKTKNNIRKVITDIRLSGKDDAVSSTYLSIDRAAEKVIFCDDVFNLDTDWETVKTDVKAIIEFFKNYNNGFEGEINELQEDYFSFMSWLYLSPFMCDLRNKAHAKSEYIFHYPIFAILYGRSNSGKSSLVETLMTSMLGYHRVIDKGSFTRTKLLALSQNFKRHPVVFDDISKQRFSEHASDIIKNESPPSESEYPCFILSMNAEEHQFPQEIIKRCLPFYTRAYLPSNDEARSADLHKSVAEIRKNLSTSLYKLYLKRVMARLKEEPIPTDILEFSSAIICKIFKDADIGDLPEWCKTKSIRTYKEDRIKERAKRDLKLLLRKSDYVKPGIQSDRGWTIEKDKIIIFPPPDLFNRTFASIKNRLPDYVVDEEASRLGRIELYKKEVEKVLDRKMTQGWRRLLGK